MQTSRCQFSVQINNDVIVTFSSQPQQLRSPWGTAEGMLCLLEVIN